MNLNAYSKKVYNYLEENDFDLIENLKLHKSDFGANHLIVELNSINKNSAHHLFLSTEDNRITVGFHNFHCHFYEDNNEDSIIKALDIFHKIKNEEYLIVNSGILPRIQIENLKNGKLVDGVDRSILNFYVTSWSGKYDSKFENKNFLNTHSS